MLPAQNKVDLPWDAYLLPIPSNSISTMQNQESGLLPARNPTPVGAGNQSQTMLLGGQFALPESIPTPEQPNSIDWVNEAYRKLSMLKEKIMPEVLIFHRRTQEKIQSATTLAEISHVERIRLKTDQVIKFLCMSRAQMSQSKSALTKEKLYHSMKQALMYYNWVRTSNSVSPAAARFRQENAVQLNNPVRPSAPSYQRQLNNGSATEQGNAKKMKKPIQFTSSQGLQMERNNLPPPSFAPRPVSVLPSAFLPPMTPCSKPSDSAKSPVLKENIVQLNNPVRPSVPSYQSQQLTGIDSNAERMKSLWRKEEKTPNRFAGGQEIQIESKDFPPPSSSPCPAEVSVSASPSAFLPPTTPCSKPSDFAKSPVSVESCRFAPCSSDPKLMKPVCEQSTDPIKRLLKAVMSASPSALKSAGHDMYAITRLSDRIATNIVNGGSMQIIQRDLADDISKFTMQSAIKDQMESSAKRLKEAVCEFLLQEIEEINQSFMELKVEVMNMDVVSWKGFDGDVLIRFSYIPVGPASQQMASKFLLELTVPPSYPNSSPTVSDKMLPSYCDSEEGENLWAKAKSVFSLKLNKLGEPMTVKQLAEAWEGSAREVFIKYAEQLGGGSLLSSTGYGGWESLGVAF